MKISKLIFLSISLILLLFTITTYVNYKQSEDVRENAEFLSVSSNIVRQSNQLQRNILNMERDLKGYRASGENYLLQVFDSAALENKTILDDLSNSIPPNTPQAATLANIRGLYGRWVNTVTSPLIEDAGKKVAERKLSALQIVHIQNEEESINKTLQQQFRELLNAEYSTREKRRFILEKSEHQTKIISVLLTALSIVIGFVIAILLANHISKRILKMVRMSGSIAKGNYQFHVTDKSNDELSELSRSLNYMAKTLEENISLLERKNKELDQFAHIVSHDLKAPLRGIDNVISWIEEDHGEELPGKVHEYLELIKGRVIRSENLIQGILEYARIGKDVAETENVDVKRLVQEIIEHIPIRRGLEIHVDKSLPKIKSERVPLTQVFSNLITNAIKYHDKEKGEIKIYCKDKGDCYEFFVEDDGPGIDEKYFDKVFIIFQTLHPRDSFESSGVGLAIVKKILEDKKEQIKVSSEPGKGTVFSFTWLKV